MHGFAQRTSERKRRRCPASRIATLAWRASRTTDGSAAYGSSGHARSAGTVTGRRRPPRPRAETMDLVAFIRFSSRQRGQDRLVVIVPIGRKPLASDVHQETGDGCEGRRGRFEDSIPRLARVVWRNGAVLRATLQGHGDAAVRRTRAP